MKKRILSAILTVAMILTTVMALPLTASANTGSFDGEGVPITVTTYAITVDSAIENGTVTSSAAKASAGATITLTVTPDEGYELDTLTVSDGTNEIETTAGEGGTYTFSMPAIAVTVTATFKATATTEPMVLYFQPNSNWEIDNARFAAYFNDGTAGTFADMTLADGETDIYAVTIPEGNYTNVIFLRMNPETTENSWSNKWNQTSDLSIPTDGTNFYTYPDGAWDNGAGTWSTYGASTDTTEPEATTKTIYFKNTDNWTNVYIYGWYDSTSTSGAWPGTVMTELTGGYWSYELSSETVNVIFNNGSTSTNDLTLPTDGSNLYTYSTNAWSTYEGGTTQPEIEIPTLDGKITVIEGKISGLSENNVFLVSLDHSGFGEAELLSVDEYGVLYAVTQGMMLEFCDEEGNALVLTEGDDIEFAVVFNDIEGTYRVAINGEFAYYNNGSEMLLANGIVHDSSFNTTEGDISLVLHDSVTLSAAYNIGDIDTAEMVALQNHNEETSIRLVAGLDTLWYNATGFDVEIYADGELVGTDMQQTTLVYESVVANGETVEASEHGHRYFSAYTIDDVELEANVSYYILVTPFTVIGETVTCGEETRINLDSDGKASFAAEE